MIADKEFNINELDKVTGGSICVSNDYKTCGYNCNNQFYINDYAQFKSYVAAHAFDMTEPAMLRHALSEGWISVIDG